MKPQDTSAQSANRIHTEAENSEETTAPPSSGPRSEPEVQEKVSLNAPEQAGSNSAIFQKALDILRSERPETSAGAQAKAANLTPVSPSADQALNTSPDGSVPSPTQPGEDQQIPARMLNEFVYCRRLFYYEFVEGVFVESADTLRGGALHQRVDSGSGALPAAATESQAQSSKAQVEADKPAGHHVRIGELDSAKPQ
jgi:CRISPR-associated protein Cas1